MTRQALERHQVWVYLTAIMVGLVIGSLAPAVAVSLDVLLWPALGTLLYVTFTQIPLTHLPGAFRDLRFMTAVLGSNFVVVPVLVATLLPLVPAEPAVRLGVLLVLLAPCTDWFITFTHLGRGDTHRALAVTPINLLGQLALLPLLLRLFMGRTFAEVLAMDRMVHVFVTLIVLPLGAAYVTERAAEWRPSWETPIARIGWLPVPLLAVVVFLIAASQVSTVAASAPLLGPVAVVFAVYLVCAVAIGVMVSRFFSLDHRSGHTLVFTLGTRNSFVVQPFALALPDAWAAAVVLIVLQSLVELWGMMGYLWIVPRLLRPTEC